MARGVLGMMVVLLVLLAPCTPEVCDVDFQSNEFVLLHIHKTVRNSTCKVQLDSVPQEEVTVSLRNLSRLSFQDCPEKSLWVSLNKSIDFSQKITANLTIPPISKCLLQHLNSITYSLKVPRGHSLKLYPSSGGLQQILPGQECSSNFTILLADVSNTLGNFCPQGDIREMQIRSNISVTLLNYRDLWKEQDLFFEVIVLGNVSDKYIFSVQPKEGTSTLLATPGWPQDMSTIYTVSWIISLPQNSKAELLFANLSQPRCLKQHTEIKVQGLECIEEKLSLREDKSPGGPLTLKKSFYLNMTNCHPAQGRFSVLTKITLQKKPNYLPVIIAPLVVALVVMVIIFLVVRRKKRKQPEDVSIYNPSVHNYLPGQPAFPKTQADNESNIYSSIDDTMVYGHLLQQLVHTGSDDYKGFNVELNQSPEGDPTTVSPKVDVYQSFKYKDPQIKEHRSPDSLKRVGQESSRSSTLHGMVDNDLYSPVAQANPPYPGTETVPTE